jgi:hypothetical protein
MLYKKITRFLPNMLTMADCAAARFFFGAVLDAIGLLICTKFRSLYASLPHHSLPTLSSSTNPTDTSNPILLSFFPILFISLPASIHPFTILIHPSANRL